MGDTETKWEQIDPETTRIRVPGGWIYSLVSGVYNNYPGGFAAVFVPDPPVALTALAPVVSQDADAATATERARCLAVARGCNDYMGGHDGRELDAFRHGVETVVNALSGDPDSTQVQALARIGREVPRG